jgi:hypothetical protein
MAEHNVSDESIKHAIAEFQKQLDADAKDQSFFCACWPCADKILKVIIGIATIDPKLKTVLEKIEKGVNDAYTKNCSATKR